MLSFLLGRLSVLVPTLIGVTLLAFGLIRIVPGDPVLLMLGERGADPVAYQEMRHNLGLDQPLASQYFTYVKNALKGDLGVSILSKRPVLEEFGDRFPATIELAMVALFFAVTLGIPLGVLAAVRQNTFLDYSIMGAALTGYSMPIFWWGLILILIFSVQLGLTPVSGRISIEYDIPAVTGFYLIDTWKSPEGAQAFWDALKHLLLPAIAVGTIPLAMIARMTRSSLLEVISEDYIRTAKAKGLSRARVIWVHAFRNVLIPVVTVIGLMFGTLVTGAILTETIFSWPGIGKWLVGSVTQRDYPVIQGGVLLIAGAVVAVNLLVDLSYALIDPKIRHPRS